MALVVSGIDNSPGQERVFFEGQAELIPLTERLDERGALLPMDFPTLPFQPCRIFVTHDVPAGTTRGGHAHRRGWQLLVRLTGRLKVAMRYNNQPEVCLLDRSDVGLLIGPRVWSEQTYLEPATTLLVLASTPYDPASYLIDSD
jgi:dTDP-4-dehydrorhamnose 3,5-epimerase-like enzyme